VPEKSQKKMRSVSVVVFLAVCAVVAASDFSPKMRARVSALEEHVRTKGKFPVGEFPAGLGERCNCAQDVCNCCAEKTPKRGPVCLDLTFDPNAQTLLIELTVNGQVVWSETKSDNKPFSKCIVKECDICVHIHNLNISRTGACGDVTFNITCPKIPVTPEKTKQFHTGGECTIPTFGRHRPAASAADSSSSDSDSDSNDDRETKPKKHQRANNNPHGPDNTDPAKPADGNGGNKRRGSHGLDNTDPAQSAGNGGKKRSGSHGPDNTDTAQSADGSSGTAKKAELHGARLDRHPRKRGFEQLARPF